MSEKTGEVGVEAGLDTPAQIREQNEMLAKLLSNRSMPTKEILQEHLDKHK